MPPMMQYGGAVSGHPAFMAAQRPPMAANFTPGQMLAPAVPRPGFYGCWPHMLPGVVGQHTPETVPVGVLATMLTQFTRRQNSDFVPYKPLDPAQTPQVLPPMEVPTPRLLQRVEDFYQDLRDEERELCSSSSSRSSSRSRSRSRSGGRGQSCDTQSKVLPNIKMMNAVPPP